jgi:hypothetical protein
MGNRSDPIARIPKSLVPSDRPIASAPGQSQGAQSQDQTDVRGRKPGSIAVPPGSTDRNRSGRAWPLQGETMIRDKPGERLRGGHRKETRPTMVNREGRNSPRVSSDREGNLEDLRHPIRDRIGSRWAVGAGKAAGEAIMRIRRETGAKRSAVDWDKSSSFRKAFRKTSCSGGVPPARNPRP